MSRSTRRLLPDGAILEYFTDIEGNYSYFQSLVARSSVLHTDPDGALALREQCFLVFGGDVCDRGSGDIRITKALTALKRRYPERVVLIAGNRDVCKLRFGSEMQPDEEPGAGDVHWDYKFATYLTDRGLTADRISGCKWLLCTMGCESLRGRTLTFELRRQELSLLGMNADDSAVAESFFASVDPASADPWLLEYLRECDLVAIVGDCMFVHSGFDKASLAAADVVQPPPPPYNVPPYDTLPYPTDVPPGVAATGAAPADALDAWAAASRRWLVDQLDAYSVQPRWKVAQTERSSPCSLTRGAGTLAYFCTWSQ